MDVAITIEHVSKTFARPGTRPATLKQALLGGLRRGGGAAPPVRALRDVSLAVARGSSLGLVGHNGAGKSTLLRLIAGVGRPDAGRIAVRGRLAALFELGVGFHGDLTGRENALLAGLVAGVSRRDITRRLPDIVDFSGIGDAIDRPVRTYSTGMRARLAFGVAIHVDADVLLLDEVLAVGDLAFQERCLERLRAFRRDGTTIVLVSHDPTRIADLCDQAALLWDGSVVATGAVDAVVSRFAGMMTEHALQLTPHDSAPVATQSGTLLQPGRNRWGSREASVVGCRLLDPWGAPTASVRGGGGLAVEVELDAPAELGPVNVSVTIARRDGVTCIDTSTIVPPGTRAARVAFRRLDLAPGDYAVDVGVYSESWGRTFDFHHAAYPLRITGHPAGKALVSPPLEWEVADLEDRTARSGEVRRPTH
jgi:lipopolysaccharide transport system ATP-binding protein